MKRTVLTMLAFFVILMGASAQGKAKNVQVSASSAKKKGTVNPFPSKCCRSPCTLSGKSRTLS